MHPDVFVHSRGKVTGSKNNLVFTIHKILNQKGYEQVKSCLFYECMKKRSRVCVCVFTLCVCMLQTRQWEGRP